MKVAEVKFTKNGVLLKFDENCPTEVREKASLRMDAMLKELTKHGEIMGFHQLASEDSKREFEQK